MQTREHNDHDAQYSYEVAPMGTLHTNMNDGGAPSLKAGRVSGDKSKSLDGGRTERFNNVVMSQNTSNSLSSSQMGKRY